MERENLGRKCDRLDEGGSNLTEDTGFCQICILAAVRVITGSVAYLPMIVVLQTSKNYSPLIHVDDSFNVNKPIFSKSYVVTIQIRQ
ncbi:MAG: hypothetical protein ACLUKE_08270 [Blautia wexlerae]